MDTSTLPVALASPESAVPSPATPKQRLLSLDIFRGVTLMAMVMVNMPGDEQHTWAAISHVRWDGWTIADLIFPFFIFIVGVAMPYSFSGRLSRGDSKAKLVGHIALRSAGLFVIGMFMTWYYNYMSGLPNYHLSNIRIFGAIQRIGLCYFFASLLYLKFKPRGLATIAATILMLYFILLRFVPVPGQGAVVLARDGNWVQYIDLRLMPHHMFHDNWEPKGWLGTFPATATMLIGVLAGLFLRSARPAMEKVCAFLIAGNVGLLCGFIWSLWIPINQNLWTSSLVVFMCGMALVLLGCCYYVADVRKFTWWSKPFIIVGLNSLFLWVAAGTTDFLTNLELVKIHLQSGERIPLPLLVSHFFARWIGPTNGSELYGVLWLSLWLGILTAMYKKRIFVKL